jgi:hypothetical protein
VSGFDFSAAFQPLTREQRLARLDAIAKLLDVAFIVPGTNIRYGVDGLIGLVPIIGDIVTTAISLWLVREARALGAPWHITARMLGNVAVDGVVGLVPVAGDAFDVMFRANMRNVRMLKRWLDFGAAKMSGGVFRRACLGGGRLGFAAGQRKIAALVERTDTVLVEAGFVDLKICAIQRVSRQFLDRETHRIGRGVETAIGEAGPLFLADRSREQFGGFLEAECHGGTSTDGAFGERTGAENEAVGRRLACSMFVMPHLYRVRGGNCDLPGPKS